ncbi:peptide chain release factor N(5)-glutamine methyltransferase [bacterium]|nr:peptide chain release factor N(5)-glutamine methyltransferase [bacterium]
MQWTTLSLLDWTTGYFEKHNIPSPRLDAEILLAHVLGLTRVQLYMQFDRPMNADELARFKELMLRRSKNEPVAYIVGNKEFYSLPFAIGPGVLIPRPETELLVEAVLKHPFFTDKTKPSHIFEVGTGSGNIIITLLKHWTTVMGTSWDISEKALEIASQNAARHVVSERLTLEKKNFLTEIQMPVCDIFVSNPPYISKTEMETVMPDVKNFEPLEALVADDDGFIFYKKIAETLKSRLQWQLAIVEVGDTQAQKVVSLFDGLGSIKTIKDYQGIERIVVIER